MDNQSTLDKLQSLNKDLKQELSHYLLQHQLISALLSADNIHSGVVEFKSILFGDYVEFTKQNNSLKDETDVLLRLQDILKELEVISSYPEFHKKRSIAVAGGFSAGKSQFISSLFENTTMKLPIGIQPTTAIPAYVMNSDSEKSEVLGCSIKGGTIDLIAIHPRLQEKLSHEFIGSFGFNLRTIMPYIFLSTAIPYKHLCFIDTPGYNPSGNGITYQDEDVTTAENFTHSAEAVLWLIGADSNGTIPATDLEFLQDIADDKKPIFIILNKADLRAMEDIKSIISVISDQLYNYDINVEGISAYSSIQQKEIYFKNLSLFSFLRRIDKPSEKQKDLINELDEIEIKYKEFMDENEKSNKKIRSQLISLRNDLLEKDLIEYDDIIIDRIDYIKDLFSNKNIIEQKENIKKIFAAFKMTINNIFGGLPTYESIRNYNLENYSSLNKSIEKSIHVVDEPLQNDLEFINKINSSMDKFEDMLSSIFSKK